MIASALLHGQLRTVAVDSRVRFNTLQRATNMIAPMRWPIVSDITLRSACSWMSGDLTKIRASDHMVITETRKTTGKMTPNWPSEVFGPKSAMGTKAAAKTTPDAHHQGAWPAPMAGDMNATPPNRQ